MEFFGSPCSLNNAPVEGFQNANTASNAELLNMYKDILNTFCKKHDIQYKSSCNVWNECEFICSSDRAFVDEIEGSSVDILNCIVRQTVRNVRR